MLTNTHDTNPKSGIWIASIADHVPVYITMPHNGLASTKSKENGNSFIYKRRYTSENILKFKSNLSSADWSMVYDVIGTNNKYSQSNLSKELAFTRGH